MKRKIFSTVAGCAFAMGVSAQSAIEATVDNVGCHIDRDQCFVYLNATVSNDASCTYNEGNGLRWGFASGEHAYAALTVFLTAKRDGKKVQVGGAGDVCYGNYMSFHWVSIAD